MDRQLDQIDVYLGVSGHPEGEMARSDTLMRTSETCAGERLLLPNVEIRLATRDGRYYPTFC